jgi:hypothetical protein
MRSTDPVDHGWIVVEIVLRGKSVWSWKVESLRFPSVLVLGQGLWEKRGKEAHLLLQSDPLQIGH